MDCSDQSFCDKIIRGKEKESELSVKAFEAWVELRNSVFTRATPSLFRDTEGNPLKYPPVNPLLIWSKHHKDTVKTITEYLRLRTGLPVGSKAKIEYLLRSRHGDFRAKFYRCFIYWLSHFCIGDLSSTEISMWLPEKEFITLLKLNGREFSSPSTPRSNNTTPSKVKSSRSRLSIGSTPIKLKLEPEGY